MSVSNTNANADKFKGLVLKNVIFSGSRNGIKKEIVCFTDVNEGKIYYEVNKNGKLLVKHNDLELAIFIYNDPWNMCN